VGWLACKNIHVHSNLVMNLWICMNFGFDSIWRDIRDWDMNSHTNSAHQNLFAIRIPGFEGLEHWKERA
jgi:hypothetical protein